MNLHIRACHSVIHMKCRKFWCCALDEVDFCAAARHTLEAAPGSKLHILMVGVLYGIVGKGAFSSVTVGRKVNLSAACCFIKVHASCVRKPPAVFRGCTMRRLLQESRRARQLQACGDYASLFCAESTQLRLPLSPGFVFPPVVSPLCGPPRSLFFLKAHVHGACFGSFLPSFHFALLMSVNILRGSA